MANPTKKTYWALVGGQTLLGRELRDLAAHSSVDLKVFDTADSEGQTLIKGDDGELEIMQPIDPNVIAGAAVVFLAADAAVAQKVLRMNPRQLIDLHASLEEVPAARLLSPGEAPQTRLSIIPAASALLLSSFYLRLQEVGPVQRSVVNVFQPASEWGALALQELQQQTIALLSFQTLKKEQFDLQAAFAMLAGFGEESPLRLRDAELRMERHLASLLSRVPGAALPMPSLRLTHAPVFHGLTASVWVEFSSDVDWNALESTLRSDSVNIHGADVEAPNNVSVAGEDGISIGAIERDRQNPKAAWFWLAADNHRLSARCAFSIAERLA